MSICKSELEYDIMEYIMKGVIFEKKSLRESFMQEVLNSAGIFNYTMKLENYLNANKITVKNYKLKEGQFPDKDPIRIIELADCEINIKNVEWLPKGKDTGTGVNE